MSGERLKVPMLFLQVLINFYIMLNHFDYLFYRFCEYYKKSDEGGYRLSAILLLSALQGLNVASIFFLIQILIGVKLKITTVHAVSYAAFFFIINLMRYKKKNYDITELMQKWRDETNVQRRRKLNSIIIYIVATVLILLIIVNYHGRHNY